MPTPCSQICLDLTGSYLFFTQIWVAIYFFLAGIQSGQCFLSSQFIFLCDQPDYSDIRAVANFHAGDNPPP